MTKMTQWSRTKMKKTSSPTPVRKTTASWAGSTLRTAAIGPGLALGLALTLGMAYVGPGVSAAHAQQRGPVRRTIEGKVEDKNDAPIKGAVVYLKDSRTLAVKSFISDEEGVFHFGQLSQNTDYELYAEFEGKRSKSKTISSFDSKNDFNFILKIDSGK